MVEGVSLVAVGVLAEEVRPVLVSLILFGPLAPVVVGARLLESLQHLSYVRELTNWLGSRWSGSRLAGPG